MTSLPEVLANGLRCALHVRAGGAGGRGPARRLALLDKATGRTLWRCGGRPGRQRLARGPARELAMLRDRLRGRPWPCDPCGRSAWSGEAARALAGLGIGAGVPVERGLALCPEPPWLAAFGRDLAGRVLWLAPAAGRAWQRMRHAAVAEGIALLPVSGWRSLLRQAALVRAKVAAGRTLAQVLAVNALPGYSEHHLGTTLDLHAGDGPVLEEAFEETAAFAWLQRHAAGFGFHLSYPRGNRHGIAYEPWHWRWHDPFSAAPTQASVPLPR